MDGQHQGGSTWTGSVRVFISHAGVDTGWAEWAAWHLGQAGYDVELDAWDWPAGDSFVHRMNEAMDRAAVVVALWSPAYFEADRFTGDEWMPLVAGRGLGRTGEKRLVPIWVADPAGVAVPATLRHLSTIRVDDLDDAAMERALVSAVAGPQRPTVPPPQPKGTAPQQRPRLPDSLPRTWNVATRSAVFSGRDRLLAQVRQQLAGGSPVAVQAMYGMGGVGKTLLAVEFAHRFAGDYDLVWWVDAEQPGPVPEQLASLAVAADLVSADATIPVAVAAAQKHLRGSGRWLVVFDNAEDPAAIRAFVPEGRGDVLITSRNPAWSGVAVPVEVDVFTRAESVYLLKRQVQALTGQDADTIAGQLGDLPLAIAQAAGVLAETHMSAGEYLNALREETEQVLSTGVPPTYPVSLAAVVRVAAKRVAAVDPAAVQLLNVCAFLAPEPIHYEWFISTASPNRWALPDTPAAIVASSFALRQRAALLARHGLARATPEGLLLHRLTAAIARDTLTLAEQAATRATAEQLLVDVGPVEAYDAALWPVWAAILPHLIHLDPATTSNGDLRELACNAALVMYLRGDSRGGGDLAQHLHRAWSASLGEDHPNTLFAANNLARCSHGLADYERARMLDQDTFTRRRRILGEDHPYTLYSASNLARDLQTLGDYHRARELEEDTLARRRRVLGDDHRDTLHSASRLTVILCDLGDYQGARELQEDTLPRSRQILGDDHPDTLSSATRLAVALCGLGDYQGARELQEDTLPRSRQVIGDDHPNTLRLASDLANTLRVLGDLQGARALQEDTLARMRRVLGDDHPDTLILDSNLAALREQMRARSKDAEGDKNAEGDDADQ